MAMAVIMILLFYFLTTQITSRIFENYKIEGTRDRDLQYGEMIENLLLEGYSTSQLRRIMTTYTRQDSVYLRLIDMQGRVIWDLNRLAGTLGHMQMGHGHTGATLETQLDFVKIPIVIDQNQIAVLEIGRPEQLFFTDQDLMFKESLQRGLWVISGLSLVIIIGLSFLFSKKLSKPIIEIRETANQIKMGRYNGQQPQSYKILEIHELDQTIRQLAENLKMQENLRTRLTHDISHELRTPLNIMQNQIEAMIDGVWDVTPQRLEQCHDEILRLTHLVNDLNQLAELQSYQLTLNKTKVDFKQLLKDMAIKFEGQLKAKSIQLNIETPEDPIMLQGDKLKLQQIMINLLSNSIKFTEKHGIINVRLKQYQKYYELQIEDNGIGIEQKDIDYIFERFYRAENSRSRQTGGAGLGLSIVKGLVEAHGGEIAISSQIGQGTLVTLQLPS